jgi:hypothetical protein
MPFKLQHSLQEHDQEMILPAKREKRKKKEKEKPSLMSVESS